MSRSLIPHLWTSVIRPSALHARERRRRPRPRHRVKLHLESLEDRTVLSGVSAANAHLAQAYGQLPLSFEANQGQADPQIGFLSHGSGYTLFLTPTEAVLSQSLRKFAAFYMRSPEELGEAEIRRAVQASVGNLEVLRAALERGARVARTGRSCRRNRCQRLGLTFGRFPLATFRRRS
jgi:hypothetical protein